MAQYKVPQDVEADDKLIGPFSFRQFVYLLVAAGLIALAVALFQIFPILAIIPFPPALVLAALALPLKKDQPMETYLAALVSFYTKPRKRVWMPGLSETTIQITAPKRVEESRTRDISSEEATHRLSFLVDIVDTEGYAIKGAGVSPMREELVAEANATADMFESTRFASLESAMVRGQNEQHEEAMRRMQSAIQHSEHAVEDAGAGATIQKRFEDRAKADDTVSDEKSGSSAMADAINKASADETPTESGNVQATPEMTALANNSDLTVATIAKEANRIKEKEKSEIFVSLH